MFGNNGMQFTPADWQQLALTAGLSILGNNNGSRSVGQLIGQGGLDALAGLQARKQYEAAMARQQMQDDMAQQKHELAMKQGQMQMDDAERVRGLQERLAKGDMRALALLNPGAYAKWLSEQGKTNTPPMPKLSDVNTTRGKFVTESGDYLSMGGSLKKILAGAKEGSGAGDLSVVFSYMKVLDPTSTVREGEFANAENSAGIPAKVTNIYNKLLNGERLTEKQRRDFVSMAKELFKAAEPAQNERVRQYTNLANQYGVSPDMIIYSPYTDLLGQVEEYLATVPKSAEVPAVNVPGVASPVPSHTTPGVLVWNPKKGDFD